MTNPTYVRAYNFGGFQASNPSTPLPGQRLDNELIEIETVLGNHGPRLTTAESSITTLQNDVDQLELDFEGFSDDVATVAANATATTAAKLAAQAAQAAAEDARDLAQEYAGQAQTVSGGILISEFAGSIDIVTNASMDMDDAENHGAPRITSRGSLLLGSASDSADNRFPNQSALEVFIQNDAAGAAVPVTIWQSGPDSASVEPVVMGRDRNPDRYGNTLAAALAGDSAWVIQGQVGDSLGTANIAIGNIGMRVQGGTTPTEGNARGFAGNIFFAVSPGDGVTAITTALEIQSDGDANFVTGRVLINNSAAITTERYGRFTGLLVTDYAAIADDAIAIIDVPNGTTAQVFGIATSVASTSPPVHCAVRVEASAQACINMSAYTTNLAFTTGVISDHTTVADGSLTISAGDDGNMYVVNRLGGSRTYGWQYIIGKENV